MRSKFDYLLFRILKTGAFFIEDLTIENKAIILD